MTDSDAMGIGRASSDDTADLSDVAVKVYVWPGRRSVTLTTDTREIAMRRMIRSINEAA